MGVESKREGILGRFGPIILPWMCCLGRVMNDEEEPALERARGRAFHAEKQPVPGS